MNEPTERQTLLIVDDEPTNIQSLARLMHEDYQVLVASSGSKALEVATGEVVPDLVLLDIQMPDLDGFSVCRELKNDPRTSSIPVIFVTARDSADDEVEGFQLGAVDYVSKPYNPELVRARVRTHMRLKRKTDLLEQLVMLDGLTDIPNRRYFEEELQRQFRRSDRDKTELSVIMMDIDSFKPYNDNYGHGAGDQCLRKVAQALQNKAGRPTDMIARYGGEEFVALLPNTSQAGAVEVAESIRQSVATLQLPHAHSDVDSVVTLSLGVATFDPNTIGHREAEALVEDSLQLVKRADAALYQAKRAGKNRVVAGS
jgi:diguanylate cyclase (GGDEF)-like protein